MNYKRWVIVKNISLVNNKEITLVNLASHLNINRTHPYFHEMIQYLIQEGALTHINTIGSTKIFTINKKKICEIVENSEVFNHLKEYMSVNKSFYAI